MGAFTGFGPQALGFFQAVAFHQDRDWFQANKALYEAEIREPMLALLDDLSGRFAAAGIPLSGGRQTLFRINRDVRFARDKRPYQTHAGAVLTRSGRKDESGLVYVHIMPAGIATDAGMSAGSFAAAGFHTLEPDRLLALRTAIRDDPTAWHKMTTALARGGLALGSEGSLQRLPRGFEAMKGSPEEAALRLKSFIVERPLPEADITRPALLDHIFALAVSARPLLDYGWKALA